MSTQRKKLKANPIKVIQVAFRYSEMTDNGDATGTFIASDKKLPAGARVLGTKSTSSVGFTGDTTASLLIGKSGATDDFGGAAATGFAAAQTKYGQPATIAESGPLATDTSIEVTVTGASDFTLITAGNMYIEVYYLDLNSKSI